MAITGFEFDPDEIVLTFQTTSTPSTPAAGNGKTYADSADGLLKYIASSGTVYDLTAGSFPFTTKGDLVAYTGVAPARVPVGNDGQILYANSSDTEGVLWGDPLTLAQGRLTLTSNTPVTSSDVTGTTLYYTPFKGNLIGLYDGTGWKLHEFTERSITNAGLAADTNYDVFLYDNSGTLTLSLTAWTNATTRATALVYQDGVEVKSGATNYRYLGTIRTWDNGGTVTFADVGGDGDTIVRRYVWNNNNRVLRPMYRRETTDTWTYASATWRNWNGDTDNHFQFVIGLNEDAVVANALGLVSAASTSNGWISVNLDSNTAPGKLSGIVYSSGGTATISFNQLCGIGYHTIEMVEAAQAATVTFAGDFGGANLQAGMAGSIRA